MFWIETCVVGVGVGVEDVVVVDDGDDDDVVG